MTHKSSLHQRFAAAKTEAQAAIIDAHPDAHEAIVIAPIDGMVSETLDLQSLLKPATEGFFSSAPQNAEQNTHDFASHMQKKGIGLHENVDWGRHMAEFAKEKGIKKELHLHGPTIDHYHELHKKQAEERQAAQAAKEDLDADVLATGPKAVACFNPSVDNAHAAAAAYHAIESRREDEAREEVGSALESLRELRESIHATNAATGFSPVSAFFANLAVEAHTSRLGFNERELTASFESAVDGQSTTIATESLDAALEAVDGVYNRMKATAIRLFAPVWTRCKLLSKSLDELAAKASRHSVSHGAMIHVKASLIAEGSEHSTDLAKSYARAAEFLKYLTGPFKEQAKADQYYNSNLVQKLFDVKEEYDTVSPEKIDAVLSQIASSWKDPRAKLGNDLTKPLIGNVQLFRDEKDEDVYRGENAAGKALNEFIVKNYPTLTGSQASDEKGPTGMVEVKALGGHEIAHLAADFKAAANNVGAMAAFLKKIRSVMFPFTALGAALLHVDHDEAVGHTSGSSYNYGDGSVSSHTSVQYRRKSTLQYTLERAYWLSARMPTHVAYDASRALLKIGHNFIKVSNLSLNAQAKAAMESWDQATAVDGVSVNETSPIEPTMTPNVSNQAPVGEVIPKQATFQDGKGGKQDLNGAVESTDNAPVEDLSKPHDLTTLTPGVKEVQAATAHTVGDGAVVESVDNSPVEDTSKLHDETTIGTQVKEVAPATAQTAQVVENAKLGGEDSSTQQVPPGKPDTTAAPNQKGDTDQSVADAKLGGEAPTGVDVPAAADADNHADGKPAAAVRSVGGSTEQTVDGSAALTGSDASGVKFEDAQALDKKGDHDVVAGVQAGVAATGHGGGPLKGAAPTGVDPTPAAPADKKADGRFALQAMKPATESRTVPYWFKPE